MKLCGFEITSQMIPRQRWDNGQVYHIGLKVLHVIVLLVRKEMFYLKPQFITLMLNIQEILTFKIGSLIIMTLWKMDLEARTLVILWMYITTQLMMMNRLLLRVNPTRRYIKELQIPFIYMKYQIIVMNKGKPTIMTNKLGLSFCYLLVWVRN